MYAKKRQIRASVSIVNSVFSKIEYAITDATPVKLGGYSYPLPVTFGQVANLPGLGNKDRSQCSICRKTRATCVNNVCSSCQESRKRVQA
jgi:hypothetical protein